MFDEDDAESAWLLEDIVRDREETGLAVGRVRRAVSHARGGVAHRGDAAAGGRALPPRGGPGAAGRPGGAVPGRGIAGHRVAGRSGAGGIARARWCCRRRCSSESARRRRRATWSSSTGCGARRGGDRGRIPEIKKLRRFQLALDNLHALGRKHTTINGLVDELLAQRVGEYRTCWRSGTRS